MDANESEMFAAIRPVAKAFEQLNVEYLIGGSVASSVYGEPRATRDVDFVARISGKHAAPFVELLGSQFYADTSAVLSAIQNQSSFNVIHLETMVKVDVFVAKRDRFGNSQVMRRRRKSVGQPPAAEFFLASPEDTILAKLDWYRQGGSTSDRQWNDILGVLKVQGDALDRAYLDEWARELKLTDLLRQAREDAGHP